MYSSKHQNFWIFLYLSNIFIQYIDNATLLSMPAEFICHEMIVIAELGSRTLRYSWTDTLPPPPVLPVVTELIGQFLI